MTADRGSDVLRLADAFSEEERAACDFVSREVLPVVPEHVRRDGAIHDIHALIPGEPITGTRAI